MGAAPLLRVDRVSTGLDSHTASPVHPWSPQPVGPCTRAERRAPSPCRRGVPMIVSSSRSSRPAARSGPAPSATAPACRRRATPRPAFLPLPLSPGEPGVAHVHEAVPSRPSPRRRHRCRGDHALGRRRAVDLEAAARGTVGSRRPEARMGRRPAGAHRGVGRGGSLGRAAPACGAPARPCQPVRVDRRPGGLDGRRILGRGRRHWPGRGAGRPAGGGDGHWRRRRVHPAGSA